MRERERERERKKERLRERERQGEREGERERLRNKKGGKRNRRGKTSTKWEYLIRRKMPHHKKNITRKTGMSFDTTKIKINLRRP